MNFFKTLKKIMTTAPAQYTKPNRNQIEVSATSSAQHSIFRCEYSSLADYKPQILSLNKNYCVINKPYDVRMDGEFDITVEKLVSKWLECNSKDLKWIHQLDYATSGVLCIGLNRQATAVAQTAFENRLTEKSYLAVLQGHLKYEDWPEYNEPFIKENFIDLTHKSRNKRKLKELKIKMKEEQTYQACGACIEIIDSKGETPQGKPNPLGNDWQDEIMKYNVQLCYDAFHKLLKDDNHREKLENNKDFHQLEKVGLSDFYISAKNRKMLRKAVQSCGVLLSLMESSSKAYEEWKQSEQQIHIGQENNEGSLKGDRHGNEEVEKEVKESSIVPDELLSSISEKSFFNADHYLAERCEFYKRNDNITSSSSSSSSLPFIYRYKDPLKNDEECLLIRIPLTENDNDFRMEPSDPSELTLPMEERKGKDCATELIILDNNCYYRDQPVTKVLLKPLTGRRHQLRIHTLCLGNPIVGDYTYNSFYRQLLFDTYHSSVKVSNEEERNKKIKGEMEQVVCERMMLHAYCLKIPLPLRETVKCSDEFYEDMLKESYSNSISSDKRKYLVDVTSPDPFPVEKFVLCPISEG
jgi:23S rRNA-/tRNA-specific pseudouridylate synthase